MCDATRLRLAVYRAVGTEARSRSRAQALAPGEFEALSLAEAEAKRVTNEAWVDRPWAPWHQLAQTAALAA